MYGSQPQFPLSQTQLQFPLSQTQPSSQLTQSRLTSGPGKNPSNLYSSSQLAKNRCLTQPSRPGSGKLPTTSFGIAAGGRPGSAQDNFARSKAASLGRSSSTWSQNPDDFLMTRPADTMHSRVSCSTFRPNSAPIIPAATTCSQQTASQHTSKVEMGMVAKELVQELNDVMHKNFDELRQNQKEMAEDLQHLRNADDASVHKLEGVAETICSSVSAEVEAKHKILTEKLQDVEHMQQNLQDCMTQQVAEELRRVYETTSSLQSQISDDLRHQMNEAITSLLSQAPSQLRRHINETLTTFHSQVAGQLGQHLTEVMRPLESQVEQLGRQWDEAFGSFQAQMVEQLRHEMNEGFKSVQAKVLHELTHWTKTNADYQSQVLNRLESQSSALAALAQVCGSTQQQLGLIAESINNPRTPAQPTVLHIRDASCQVQEEDIHPLHPTDATIPTQDMPWREAEQESCHRPPAEDTVVRNKGVPSHAHTVKHNRPAHAAAVVMSQRAGLFHSHTVNNDRSAPGSAVGRSKNVPHHQHTVNADGPLSTTEVSMRAHRLETGDGHTVRLFNEGRDCTDVTTLWDCPAKPSPHQGIQLAAAAPNPAIPDAGIQRASALLSERGSLDVANLQHNNPGAGGDITAAADMPLNHDAARNSTHFGLAQHVQLRQQGHFARPESATHTMQPPAATQRLADAADAQGRFSGHSVQRPQYTSADAGQHYTMQRSGHGVLQSHRGTGPSPGWSRPFARPQHESFSSDDLPPTPLPDWATHTKTAPAHAHHHPTPARPLAGQPCMQPDVHKASQPKYCHAQQPKSMPNGPPPLHDATNRWRRIGLHASRETDDTNLMNDPRDSAFKATQKQPFEWVTHVPCRKENQQAADHAQLRDASIRRQASCAADQNPHNRTAGPDVSQPQVDASFSFGGGRTQGAAVVPESHQHLVEVLFGSAAPASIAAAERSAAHPSISVGSKRAAAATAHVAPGPRQLVGPPLRGAGGQSAPGAHQRLASGSVLPDVEAARQQPQWPRAHMAAKGSVFLAPQKDGQPAATIHVPSANRTQHHVPQGTNHGREHHDVEVSGTRLGHQTAKLGMHGSTYGVQSNNLRTDGVDIGAQDGSFSVKDAHAVGLNQVGNCIQQRYGGDASRHTSNMASNDSNPVTGTKVSVNDDSGAAPTAGRNPPPSGNSSKFTTNSSGPSTKDNNHRNGFNRILISGDGEHTHSHPTANSVPSIRSANHASNAPHIQQTQPHPPLNRSISGADTEPQCVVDKNAAATTAAPDTAIPMHKKQRRYSRPGSSGGPTVPQPCLSKPASIAGPARRMTRSATRQQQQHEQQALQQHEQRALQQQKLAKLPAIQVQQVAHQAGKMSAGSKRAAPSEPAAATTFDMFAFMDVDEDEVKHGPMFSDADAAILATKMREHQRNKRLKSKQS